MPYHPSQQIPAQHERLFSRMILESLFLYSEMLGELKNSTRFAHEDLLLTKELPQLNFSQKLGHLYEDALAALLLESSRYQLATHNFQLITPEKHTIGELDYLLWDKQEEVWIHLELAIKFYLVHHQGASTFYPGPDARDNYQRKLARLVNHQLTLTKRPEAKALISPYTHDADVNVQHLVLGIFFDHIHAKESPLPEAASPKVRRRKWLHCREFSEAFPNVKTTRIIPKQLWLCEINAELFACLVEVPTSDLLELAQQRCTMCINSIGEPVYFVAPDRWPNLEK